MRVAVLESRDFEVKHSRATDRSYLSEYEDKMAEAAEDLPRRMSAGRGADGRRRGARRWRQAGQDLGRYKFGATEGREVGPRQEAAGRCRHQRRRWPATAFDEVLGALGRHATA
jgi:hypothetical protein